MNIKKKTPFTPFGYKLLQARIEKIENSVNTALEQMGQLAQGDPGDGYHDNLFLQTQLQLKQLEIQLQEMKSTLANVSIIELPSQTTTVDYGHKLKLKLIYAEDDVEMINAVFVSRSEASLLANLANDQWQPLSDESPIGLAIQGVSKGDVNQYLTPGGQTVRAQIIDIQIWNEGFLKYQPMM